MGGTCRIMRNDSDVYHFYGWRNYVWISVESGDIKA